VGIIATIGGTSAETMDETLVTLSAKLFEETIELALADVQSFCSRGAGYFTEFETMIERYY
jgi:hypothetical protein